MLDVTDRQILSLLQEDSAMPLAQIASKVGLSSSPCWRRIQKLEEAGLIRKRVALLDGTKLNLGVTVFMSIRTNQHDVEWLSKFAGHVIEFPEIQEVYRMSGEVDYLLKVVVPSIEHYDGFYKRLIETLPLSDVNSSFALEQIKYTTALPLEYA